MIYGAEAFELGIAIAFYLVAFLVFIAAPIGGIVFLVKRAFR